MILSTITNDQLWKSVLAEIQLNISRANFITWFQETGIHEVKEGIVTVSVPTGFAKEWLQTKYHKAILRAVRNFSGDIKEVNYVISRISAAGGTDIKHEREKKKKIDSFSPLSSQRADTDEEQLEIKELTVNPDTNLNPRYTFDSFVVGSFNELAHAAAMSIVNNPGTTYNPFFVYGGVGLGKTHLIQAIGNEIIKRNRLVKAKYTSSEKFMGEILEALKNQEMQKLKDKYRSVDLLIMDDIQFIAKTEKMQEEFFHLFNSLYEKNKQIIISSDRPPRAIPTLEERLKSRFEGGMMADIGQPDVETRITILKIKAEAKNISITEDVLRFIAEQVKTNIRELEGALNRIIINSKLTNSQISLESTKKLIAKVSFSPQKFTSAKKIIKTVAEFYDIDEKDLTNRSRKKQFVKPRQIAMFLMRNELKSSYPYIGEKLGGRDHTTAIHSCEKVTNDLKKDSQFEEEIKLIKDRLFVS